MYCRMQIPIKHDFTHKENGWYHVLSTGSLSSKPIIPVKDFVGLKLEKDYFGKYAISGQIKMCIRDSLYAEELQVVGEEKISGENFVDECQVESDLELLFPNEYIPSSSERMLLYRELDGLELDKDLLAFKARLEDRFGKVPP